MVGRWRICQMATLATALAASAHAERSHAPMPYTETASSISLGVPLSGLGRFAGWRDNALVGYGIVVGLAGSGDSRRNSVTRQALQNVYSRLGTIVSEDQISARNVAVVLVIATLPASANVGDRISVTVSSAGDARSLAGGALLMTPLLGPDREVYALAQGSLITGGYSFESESNLRQRNYPTTGRIDGGATVERSVDAFLVDDSGRLAFLLDEPNFSTANAIAQSINQHFQRHIASAKSADEVEITYNGNYSDLTGFLAAIETLKVVPHRSPRVVINERTGTIVAGGDVSISSVVISQGDIRISVDAENFASQPSFISGFATDVESLIISNSELEVEANAGNVVQTFGHTTIADLVESLAAVGVDTRRTISILQAIKSAGALHAEIIVQ